MSLDPAARQLLDMVYRAKAPRFHELDPTQARNSFEKLVFALRPTAPEGVVCRDIQLPGVDGHPLRARIYEPEQRAAGLRPGFVWFHGGGWCVGSLSAYDVVCKEFARQADVVVVSVDYRLAPEHPYPAAVDDAWQALQWIAFEGRTLGIDASALVVGGDSAGGKLAAVTALHARDEGLPHGVRLRGQVLVYPCVEIESDRPSRSRFAEGYFLDTQTLDWFFEHYFADPEHRYHWRASPLLADSMHDLPPACLITAGCDPLTDDALAFAQRLQEAYVPVEVHQYAGQVHGFLTLGKTFPAAGEALEAIGVFVSSVVRG